ncbi:MAG: hypothetical protein HC830_03115 [Bacteroidetes bacterium]|nr:hypothetical protein [Bacteroidota bacterium]
MKSTMFDSRDYSFRQFTSNTQGLQLQNDKINFTYQDKRGNLWIVYSRIGIFVVPSKNALDLVNNKSTGKIRPIDANALFSVDPRANSYITSFYDDKKGRLWVGGWGDSYVLDFLNGFDVSINKEQLKTNTRSVQIYSEEKRDQYNFTISPVSSIIEMNRNIYWLGTRSGGIIEIEEVSDFKFVGRESDLNDKLPSNNVNCFYIDKTQNLWIGTNLGLCYLNKSSLKIINIKKWTFL